jgi:hypothetical protein
MDVQKLANCVYLKTKISWYVNYKLNLDTNIDRFKTIPKKTPSFNKKMIKKMHRCFPAKVNWLSKNNNEIQLIIIIRKHNNIYVKKR